MRGNLLIECYKFGSKGTEGQKKMISLICDMVATGQEKFKENRFL